LGLALQMFFFFSLCALLSTDAAHRRAVAIHVNCIWW
jgi:hypothetical protein